MKEDPFNPDIINDILCLNVGNAVITLLTSDTKLGSVVENYAGSSYLVATIINFQFIIMQLWH